MVTVINSLNYYNVIFDLLRYNLSKGYKCYIITPEVVNDYDFYFQLVKDEYTEEEYRNLGKNLDEYNKLSDKYHFKNAYTINRCKQFKLIYNTIKSFSKDSKVFIINADKIKDLDVTEFGELPQDIYLGIPE